MTPSVVRAAMLATLVAAPAIAHASTPRPLDAQSFPIGNSGSVCEAQGVRLGEARGSLFDRKWALICRDVNRPVGTAWSVITASNSMARLAGSRGAALDCDTPTIASGAPAGTMVSHCRETSGGLEWLSYSVRSGDRTVVVEGLSAYDSALRLALASLAQNQIATGPVEVVSTGNVGSLAAARAALGDSELLIGQGYRQNNAGEFTAAEEYFRPDAVAPGSDNAAIAAQQHEVMVNRALQLSNVGRFDEAQRIFQQAAAMDLRDPIQSRLARNFEAIDAINRGQLADARKILARPVPELVDPVAAGEGAVQIDKALSNGLNSGLSAGLTDAVAQDTRLTTSERAAIIDAQALQLAATADRLDGKPAAALQELATARSRIAAVREGRVVSAARLEAQLMSEMALAHESLGQNAEAEKLLRDSLALLELRYPQTAAVSGAQARLAAFLTRHGDKTQALGLYHTIVAATAQDHGALVGLENQLVPYFDILAADGQANPALASDMFAAAQLIERPGAAQTLSQLTRRLAAGSSEASDLFRRETSVKRELNRVDLQLASLQAPGAKGDPATIAELTAERDRLGASQLELLTALSAYPAYRSQAHDSLAASDIVSLLKPGEAYLELVEVGGSMYAVFLSPQRQTAWKVGASSQRITDLVRTLRDSVSVTVGGVNATYPFDVDHARELYDLLFAPANADLAQVKHLIFQPDGALMELPVNLLIADQAGVDAYHRNVAKGGDEYDFRGIGWLGRGRAISTALSPASFRDARNAPSSKAAELYLGLGHNEPVGPVTHISLTRGASGMSDDCSIPLAAWNRPISAEELVFASKELGPDRSKLITGQAFTDSAVEARTDLDTYRIVHFATHGIVTAPKPSCPVRPALLTSFGGPNSDGLMEFGEIFDMKLDADLVILSACNTASLAGIEATRAAGIEGGGGQALDGLVRAFIGAGGRQVIASHWPAPDEFGATRRLFEAFFSAPQSEGMGDALLAAETRLMDDPDTSHPFYWAGMALIGDGARPLFHTN